MFAALPIAIAVFAAVVLLSGLVTVSQGTVAIITMFGKYSRLLRPGLNFKLPIFESGVAPVEPDHLGVGGRSPVLPG